jgi:DinB superfamily
MDPLLQRALDAIDHATAGITDEQLAWRPQAGKWCTAEVLEHLSLAFSGTAKGLSKTLAAGEPNSRRPTLKERLRISWVVELGMFPPGRKAPEMVVPRGIAPRQALAEIRANLIAMDKIIAQCDEQFGRRVEILTHPVLGPLRVRQWRKFHFVHTRHHMKQILTRRAMAGKMGADAATQVAS